MELLVTQAQTAASIQISNILVEDIFKRKFNFNYPAVSAKSPDFNKFIINAHSVRTGELIGTITLSTPSESGLYPSEYYFGFKIPSSLSNQYIIEMGRLVKTDNPKYDPIVYLSLLLAVKEYSKARNVERWIASAHTSLLESIRNLGIEVDVLDTNAKPRPDLHDDFGSYTQDASFITATMKSSFEALEKFEYLIQNKIISIEIE